MRLQLECLLTKESEIKKDSPSDMSLNERTEAVLCHICRVPTEAGAGVCGVCLKDLPLESEIKREVVLPSDMSLNKMNEAESLVLEWIKLGRDLSLNAYCLHQISVKTIVSGE